MFVAVCFVWVYSTIKQHPHWSHVLYFVTFQSSLPDRALELEKAQMGNSYWHALDFDKVEMDNSSGYVLDFERTWWWLFQKRVVRTKFDSYVFIW